jgi:hypothetical protein
MESLNKQNIKLELIKRDDFEEFGPLNKREKKVKNKQKSEEKSQEKSQEEVKLFCKTYKQTQLKSKICMKNECNDKDKCPYAHSISEYRTPNCFNHNRCFSLFDEGHKCVFKHPGETDEDVYLRLGLDKIKKMDLGMVRCRVLCRSVTNSDYNCLKGDDCSFAHNLDELIVDNCPFNDTCINDKCRKKHFNETRTDVLTRLNLHIYKDVHAKRESKPSLEIVKPFVEVAKTKITKPLTEVAKTKITKPLTEVVNIEVAKPVEVAKINSTNDLTIINVPVNLALEALNMALSRGIKNVKINIV